MNATEETIFNAALDKHDPRDRSAYLDQACGGDVALRNRIEQLVSAYGEGAFLEAPAAGFAATLLHEPVEKAGKLIGPYKLLEQIGEGGMGLVYMAEQQRPVRRLVALKLVKPGMDSKQVIARFEAERQALAMMDHSHIAKVLDAGTTEAGRPYFVMELVRGIPINQLCDDKRLAVHERLELFIQVCQAVQHAHQKGIIHRDLKPTNVLVTMNDSVPVPKIIDFGIAKALGAQLTEHTLHTGFAQLVGTPLYMSPEQAEMNQFGVDTRSDVYSLGVMLYELLTGTTPFDKDRLKSVGFDEMRRIIREEEPETVSVRLDRTRRVGSAHQPTSSSLAPNPQPLAPRRSELDWIVMKALAKDRCDRYESASSLAADLQRYLNGDLVQACPPSPAYRFRKFAAKNRALLTTTAIVAASLILGTGISIWQAIEANHARGIANQRLTSEQQARREAEQARKDAEGQRQLAESAGQRAEEERQHAEASFRKAVQAVDRLLSRFANEKLRNLPQSAEVRKEILRDAVEFLEGFLQERPHDFEFRLEAASTLRGMTNPFNLLDLRTDSRKVNQRSHDLLLELYKEQPDHLGVRCDLAKSYLSPIGRGSNPEGSIRNAIQLLSPVIDDPSVDDNIRLVFRFRLAECYRHLANELQSQGRKNDEEQARRMAIAVLFVGDGSSFEVPSVVLGGREYVSTNRGDAKRDLAAAYHSLALFLERTGRVTEAIDAVQQAVEWGQAAYQISPNDPVAKGYLAGQLCTLGDFLIGGNRIEEALAQLRKAFPILTQLLRDAPSDTYRRHVKGHSVRLIRAYQKLEKTGEVRQFLDQLNPRTASDYALRASLYEYVPDWQAARGDYQKALEIEPGNAAAQQALARIKTK